MASITTWTRLEPRSRSDDLTPSLEGRVHDPAWLLGRQWQVGEFVGEDAGTPVRLDLAVQAAPIVAYRAGSQVVATSPGTPLDALAGGEPRAAMTLAEAAEAGAELAELLAEQGCSPAGVGAVVAAHPLPGPVAGTADDEGLEFLALLAGRLPDAAVLEPVLREAARTGQAPAALGVPDGDAEAAVQAAIAWVAWRDSLERTAPAGGDAWRDDHLEHTFTLGVQPAAGDGTPFALSAPAWTGDRLDWYDLDVDRDAVPPARPMDAPPLDPLPGVNPATGRVEVAGLPAPLGYLGMPAARWWQFEDASVAFAQITAAPTDLARMLVVEFASVYSNDWYLWPLVLPVGAVHTVTRLTVTNTFGESTDAELVPSSAAGSTTADWQMFRPTERRQGGSTAAYAGLVLAPALASPVTGAPVEEVLLLRDELANLAWAVETSVPGADGRPFDRHTAAARSPDGLPASTAPGPDQAAGDTAELRYRFATDVPVHWFPLVPAPGGAPMFERLLLRRVDIDGTVRGVPPLGRILRPDPLRIWQEEVPREGALVTRRRILARGTDGTPHVWTGRVKRAGRGQSSSGLRYDDALPPPGLQG